MSTSEKFYLKSEILMTSVTYEIKHFCGTYDVFEE